MPEQYIDPNRVPSGMRDKITQALMKISDPPPQMPGAPQMGGAPQMPGAPMPPQQMPMQGAMPAQQPMSQMAPFGAAPPMPMAGAPQPGMKPPGM